MERCSIEYAPSATVTMAQADIALKRADGNVTSIPNRLTAPETLPEIPTTSCLAHSRLKRKAKTSSADARNTWLGGGDKYVRSKAARQRKKGLLVWIS